MRRTSVLAGAILAAACFGTASFAQTNPGQTNPGDGNAARTDPQPARGTVVGDLLANGFEKVRDTSVLGDFDGCEQDRQVPLKGGGVFTCASFGYMHAHNPKAVLLKKKDANQYKLVIENAVYDGVFGYG